MQDDVTTVNGFFNKHINDVASTASIVFDATAHASALNDALAQTAIFAAICELNTQDVPGYQEAVTTLSQSGTAPGQFPE